jgi:hypothetical protein
MYVGFLSNVVSIERTAGRNRYILLAIQRVGHRRRDGSAAGLKMPLGFPVSASRASHVLL